MILDKLMEVKDLRAYIKFRIEHLEKNKKGILSLPEKKRHSAYKQLQGRIEELKFLRSLIWRKNKIKEQSKKHWKDNLDVIQVGDEDGI